MQKIAAVVANTKMRVCRRKKLGQGVFFRQWRLFMRARTLSLSLAQQTNQRCDICVTSWLLASGQPPRILLKKIDGVSMSQLTRTSLFLALMMGGQAQAMVFNVERGDSKALADAIVAANDNPGADVIELEAGLYSLQQQIPSSHGLVALPVITDDLVIRGDRAELRAYTAKAVHLLQIAKGAQVQIIGVTLAEGSDGALVNFGNTELRRVQIIDQSTRTASAIVSNYGNIQLRRCELSFNTVNNAAQNAGTIVNYGLAKIQNTRMIGNIVSRRFESLMLASAILNYGSAELSDVKVSDSEAIESFPSFQVRGKARAFINEGTGSMQLSNTLATNNLPVE